MEDVKDSENLAFQDLLEYWADTTCRLPNTSIRTHFGFDNNLKKDAFCISDPLEKFLPPTIVLFIQT